MPDITLWLPGCLAQGIDKSDPKTGKPNIEALADEIADVTAAVAWLDDVITLPPGRDVRTARKLHGFREWQQLLEAAE